MSARIAPYANNGNLLPVIHLVLLSEASGYVLIQQLQA